MYAFAAGREGGLPWEALRNDLQPVVMEGWPEVAEVVHCLERCAPLHAAVTGSGSAAFALFEERESARAAADGLGDRWWVHCGATLGRSGVGDGCAPVKEDVG